MNVFDVAVAGGGSAGLAAAVAAARAGANTLLIERGGALGGMPVSAFVHTICGLYEIDREPNDGFANEGFPAEFARGLLRRGGAHGPVRMGRLDVLLHDPVRFAALADDFASSTSRLTVWLHSELAQVSCEADRIDRLEVLCRGRSLTIEAKTFIDTTGDAALTALAGADCEQEPTASLQRPAYIAQLRGVPPAHLKEGGRMQLAHLIVRAVTSGELPRESLGAGFRESVQPGSCYLTIDLAGDPRVLGEWDPTSPGLLTGVELAGRRVAIAIAAYLRTNLEGCEECAVTAWPSRAGVRESRRIAGVYQLRGDDILGGREFPDAIARAVWPLELRERATGARWRFPEGRSGQIPLRSLHHRTVENLWSAGRCMACDHAGQASIRVIGTCLATGEATGLAAALAPGMVQDWLALAESVKKARTDLTRIC
ncbi:MAG: FAD-dependent oxidoreductase [Chthoniobacterales bacterium]